MAQTDCALDWIMMLAAVRPLCTAEFPMIGKPNCFTF